MTADRGPSAHTERALQNAAATLQSNSGDDQVFGDAGNDALHGGGGDDLCNGGRGRDEQIRETCETVVAIESRPDGNDGRLPDDGSLDAPCELWEQDCGDGLKCVGSGVDDEFTCQPVVDNFAQIGDPCEALRQGDTCDVDGMCINDVCIAVRRNPESSVVWRSRRSLSLLSRRAGAVRRDVRPTHS